MTDNRPDVMANLVHVKHFVLRCMRCTTATEVVVMSSGRYVNTYMCMRCGRTHRLSDEEMAMKRQDRQPVGVDKRPEAWL
jgi:Zn ribbon nucleic-acid-binding protein